MSRRNKILEGLRDALAHARSRQRQEGQTMLSPRTHRLICGHTVPSKDVTHIRQRVSETTNVGAPDEATTHYYDYAEVCKACAASGKRLTATHLLTDEEADAWVNHGVAPKA